MKFVLCELIRYMKRLRAVTLLFVTALIDKKCFDTVMHT